MAAYLNKDILSFLLEDDTPEVKYITLKKFFPQKKLLIENAKKNILNSPFVKNIISSHVKNNIFGNTKAFDNIKYGTIPLFYNMVARGFDASDFMVENTANYIIENYFINDTGFTINWKPFMPVVGWTADVLYSLLKSGFIHEKISKSVSWIANSQNSDGGWTYFPAIGTINTLKMLFLKKSFSGVKEEDKSDLEGSLACLKALLEYRKKTGDKNFDNSIKKGLDFLIENHFDVETGDDLIKFPFMGQYSLVNFLNIAAEMGKFNDKRLNRAFNFVLSKTNEEGKWNRTKDQVIFSAKRAGFSDKWTTFCCAKLMNYADQL